MPNHAFANCRGAKPGALYGAFVEALKAGLGRFDGTARVVEERENDISVALFPPDGDTPGQDEPELVRRGRSVCAARLLSGPVPQAVLFSGGHRDRCDEAPVCEEDP